MPERIVPLLVETSLSKFIYLRLRRLSTKYKCAKKTIKPDDALKWACVKPFSHKTESSILFLINHNRWLVKY